MTLTTVSTTVLYCDTVMVIITDPLYLPGRALVERMYLAKRCFDGSVNKTIVTSRVAAAASRKTIVKSRLAAAAGRRYV